MHGNGFTYQGMNLASMAINPGVMVTLNSEAMGHGFWQLMCHVSDHDARGMVDKLHCARQWVLSAVDVEVYESLAETLERMA
jgi:hypothetical protein